MGMKATYQCGIRDILCTACANEVNVSDENRDPGEEAENSYKVDKVKENGATIVADVHEGQQRERRGNGKRVDGNTSAICLPEDGGGFTLLC